MGLFGALFAGVSGLDSQSNKIGVISNNISNVNTVGYKQGQSTFDTLVVPSGTTSFSPGGVIGGNQQLVNEQGVIAATTSPTDIAISGGGMLFVSNSAAGGANNLLFTRAGSFSQDENGNFVNSNGYFLQGLPIDSTTGKAASPNTQNLVTVNVSSSATGKPTPTSLITLGANFNASQTPLLGPGETITALTGNNNTGVSANQIIVGNDVTGENTINGIKRGDTFSITDSANTTPQVFTYGGFSIGRNIGITVSGTNAALGGQAEGATPAGGLGDGNNLLDTETNQTITTANGSSQITVTVANTADYSTTVGANGNFASIAGVAGNIGGLTPAQLNGEWQVVAKGVGNITLQLAAGSIATGGAGPATTTVSNRTFAFSGNILDAKSVTDDFLGVSGASLFATDAKSFTIQVANVGTTKLSYNSNPNPSSGSFNSLVTLAEAINDSTGSGLTAQVTDGRIYISATNPNNAVTYINGDVAGNATGFGINWVQELDLPPAGTPNINLGSNNVPGVHFFNSLQSLDNAVNVADPVNLVATLSNPTGASTLSINEANALQTITFTDGNLSLNPVVTNSGSLLKEFGFSGLISSGTGINETTGTLPATYDATDPKRNMSSGAITPQFTKDITIFDSLGQSQTIAINVSKIDTASATWAVEITAVPPDAVVSDDLSTDGQIAHGTAQFNGNGVLTTASSGLQNFTIDWNQNPPPGVLGGASPSPITLNLGLNNTSTTNGIGLTQAAGAFNVSTAQQNGSPTGELTGVSIDSNGFVIASFSNGQTQKMFQLPLANFTNPNGLEAVSGDAYQATLASGTVNPELAGTSGVGTFTPSALEQSNVDLSTQLTDLIVAQQAYGANSKLLTVSDQLLQELDQIIQ